MQAMICELCGSNEIIKQNGVYVCQHCGTKYSIDEAKKLIGVVQIDKTNETENLLILARRAKEENNNENAAKYYDMVLRNDPTNWEASFYQVYFQAMGCRIGQIESAAVNIANNTIQTVRLIHDHVDKSNQSTALAEISQRSIYIANLLASAARTHYSEFSATNNALSEYNNRIISCMRIYGYLEGAIKGCMSNEADNLLLVQKSYIEFIYQYGDKLKSDTIKEWYARLESENKKSEPSYEAQKLGQGGCYVATCVYGSYDCPQVWILRRFRDYTLAESLIGRLFIKTYYFISPTIVKLFGQTQWFHHSCSHILDKVILHLKERGFDDTPYNDRTW